MTLRRMDNVLIVVDDLEAAKAFLSVLRRRLWGFQSLPTTRATVEGRRG